MDFVFRRTYRGPLRAAILDWAGTTLDYGCCAPAVVFMEVFKRRGVEISAEEARAPMGAEKRQHILEITQMARVASAWTSQHGSAPADADVDGLYAEFVPMQVDCLKDYADLIPGTLAAVDDMRGRGMKIGSSSGYSREMMDALIPLAAQRGYTADSVVSASEVPKGRPAPWMALKSAEQMNVYPVEAIVKIGDTAPDVGEGLNAGMWTIGLAATGNEMGLSASDAAALDDATRERRLGIAYDRLAKAGAHYVVDGIGDVPPILNAINARLASGERP